MLKLMLKLMPMLRLMRAKFDRSCSAFRGYDSANRRVTTGKSIMSWMRGLHTCRLRKDRARMRRSRVSLMPLFYIERTEGFTICTVSIK
jgi:hypothetical protein